MCGRARLAMDVSEIKIVLDISDLNDRTQHDRDGEEAGPHWNIAPSRRLPVAYRENGQRILERFTWGLIPSWAKDAKMGFSTFNARAESVDAKPAFRGAWQAGRRCLVVTDGFYEWRKSDKQPFAMAVIDEPLMILAGLWDQWQSPDGELLRSFTVITTEANAMMAPIHDRMPVILARADWPKWLGETAASDAELKALLRSYPPERMKAWPVSKRVGNVKNDGPDLVAPAEPELRLL